MGVGLLSVILASGVQQCGIHEKSKAVTSAFKEQVES